MTQVQVQVRRYSLDYAQLLEVALPEGAEIIHVGYRSTDENPSLWALIDPEAVLETRVFVIREDDVYVAPTANAVVHIGSYFLPNGYTIFHVFELMGT